MAQEVNSPVLVERWYLSQDALILLAKGIQIAVYLKQGFWCSFSSTYKQKAVEPLNFNFYIIQNKALNTSYMNRDQGSITEDIDIVD